MIKSGYVMGVVQNHFYHAVKVITLRKNLFFEKINLLCNSVHLDRQNEVQYVPLSYSADIDDFVMTYENFMNALEI